MSGKKSIIREYAEAIIIAVVLALFIRTFVVQAFKIPSGSMIPTLNIGDHILVNKFIYGVKIPFTAKVIVPAWKPKRGDIIVFKYPENEKKDFIKRVIGLPGDTIEIREKTVFINGQPIAEPYIVHQDTMILEEEQERDDCGRDNCGPIKVPEDSYFVMGDNRDQSLDSRFWGIVKLNKIKGKAFIIYWSWDGDHSWVRWKRLGTLIK